MSRKAKGIPRTEVLRAVTQRRRMGRVAYFSISQGTTVKFGTPRQTAEVEEVTPDGHLRLKGRAGMLCALEIWGVE